MPIDPLFEANPNKFFDRIDPATRGAGMDFQDIFFSLFRMKSEKADPLSAEKAKPKYINGSWRGRWKILNDFQSCGLNI